MIPRKQSARESDWHTAIRRIYAAPDAARAEQLLHTARTRIERRLSWANSPALAWSGGKDSIGLEIAAESFDLPKVMSITALEFPAFLAEVDAIQPPRLETIKHAHLNWEWIAANPQHLFPSTSARADGWFGRVQRAGNREFMLGRGHDLLVTGHRTMDGNQCGPVSETGAERIDRGGFVRYAPIYDWSHEDLLHVMAHRGRPMPGFYFWPRGFRVGTGAWPARRCESTEQGWNETYYIDPATVHRAADLGLPGAALYLEGLK